MQLIENTRRTPNQRRAWRTISYIFEGTAQLLSRPGTQKLTTNHIAERAGISVGTLYRYFRNKEELLDSLLRAEVRKSIERARTIIEDQEVSSADELIEKLVELELSFYRHR